MNDVLKEIKSALSSYLKENNIEENITIEHPKDLKNGDFTTNLPLVLAKKMGKSPKVIADEIVTNLKIENVEKIETAGVGFINFYLSKEFLREQIGEIIKMDTNFGRSSLGKGRRASVEYVSANPTGPLHIGNARGGPIGDVLSNVLEMAGYEVTREYLHNDVGGQVERLGEAIYFELNPKDKPEDIQYQGEYIKDLALKVKEKLGEVKSANDAGKAGVEILFEEIMKDTLDMGIKYDVITKESELQVEAEGIIDDLKSKKVIKENEGALWFAPNDDFLKDRESVVKKSDGNWTYFASDIVYHKRKFDRGNDLVVDVLGSNHSGHVPKLQAIVKTLGFDVSNFKVILYQYVRIKRGEEIVKMSKRSGDIITAREVLDEVGKDAFRFFLLMARPETHMDFDLDLAKKKATDNPVFYVQYAHSRIESIFKKESNYVGFDSSRLDSQEDFDLLRYVLRLSSLVEELSQTHNVHHLTSYATELATELHRFYEGEKVISDDKEKQKAKLALLKAAQIGLRNTLTILGVSAPDRM